MYVDPFAGILEDVFGEMMRAVSEKRYARIDQMLQAMRKDGLIFSPPAACALLNRALEIALALKGFRALLDQCPPVPEIVAKRGMYVGLMVDAARQNRADVLDLLLQRGADPNSAMNCFSPLESALGSQSLSCVKLLMAQPELDTTWTTSLLREWAKMGMENPKLDACLQAMAPRFTGWDAASRQPLPIPRPMTAQFPAVYRNWPLLERLCRERDSIPLEEGSDALDAVIVNLRTDMTEQDQVDCAAAVRALLNHCHGLLRRHKDCRPLLRCFLFFQKDAREILQPFVDRVRRRRISMEESDWRGWNYSGLLDRWQSLLPQGPALVLDRWTLAFGEISCAPRSRDLRRILSCCPVRGKGRIGKVSPLAKTVLLCGDPALVADLFQPGALLAGEDAGALLDLVREDGSPYPKMNRNAVLAYAKKETSYAL